MLEREREREREKSKQFQYLKIQHGTSFARNGAISPQK
jgi:hypothetical protein